MLPLILTALGLLVYCSQVGAANPCVARDYRHGSVVCVCNSTYCDTIEPTTTQQLAGKKLRHYVSSKAGKRFSVMDMSFSSSAVDKSSAGAVYTVDRATKYQEIMGFGGAPTDSASINIQSLNSGARNNLLRAYFSSDGIGYTFLRVPMGGCDFSPRYYAYDDDHTGDAELKYFNLTDEDYLYKIPVIKDAMKISPTTLKLFSTPWSAPDWMKNIVHSTRASSLKPEYHKTWANYFVKFLQMYQKHGITFWGLTPQNEPKNGLQAGYFNMMGWTPEQLRDWMAGFLVPALKAAGYGHIAVMANDDQRQDVPIYAEKYYGNKTVKPLVSGQSVHWYYDTTVSPDVLTKVHDEYPDKFILYTEACIYRHTANWVVLGSWDRAVQYASNIIQNLNHWVNGWIEWNLALSETGGPSWYGNSADSPIIVNKTAGEFYKEPMFYAIGHFSKFVTPGSRRVELKLTQGTAVESVAFVRTDGIVVVVLHNTGNTAVEVVLKDSKKGEASLNLAANSLNTILY